MFVEFLIKKIFQSCSARTEFTWMHVLLSGLNTIFLIRSLYVKSHSIASTSNTAFWWTLQIQTEWVIFEPAWTHHFGLKAHKFQRPIFIFGCFSLQVKYNSCTLQGLLQVAKLLLMYSFTYTNIEFLFRHLPNEIFIFTNVCYQTKYFSGDSFSFFRSRFCKDST